MASLLGKLVDSVSHHATKAGEAESCPHVSATAVDFTPPSTTKLRVRPAAHLVDDDYVKKYERAIKLMKDLPADDPRRIYLQANVQYCPSCKGAHALQEQEEQSHSPSSGLSIPWHRMYLFFYERILGKFLGDDDFAVPFWNWDHPDGMKIPALFTDTSSPLYNHNRSLSHLPPRTVILDYRGTDPDAPDGDRQIQDKLAAIRHIMIADGKSAKTFMEGEFLTPSPSAGSNELPTDRNFHAWSANLAKGFGEDMGNFYPSGRDAMFYGLHANVDRLWDVWTKTLNNQNFDDEEWLNAAFYFYDENKQVVKVKVSDALDSEKLGYTYEPRELPWLCSAPVRSSFKAADQMQEPHNSQ